MTFLNWRFSSWYQFIHPSYLIYMKNLFLDFNRVKNWLKLNCLTSNTKVRRAIFDGKIWQIMTESLGETYKFEICKSWKTAEVKTNFERLIEISIDSDFLPRRYYWLTAPPKSHFQTYKSFFCLRVTKERWNNPKVMFSRSVLTWQPYSKLHGIRTNLYHKKVTIVWGSWLKCCVQRS